ncbi:hypothetical protein BH11ACT6_BH11ACT6_11150 [soil metagenome]
MRLVADAGLWSTEGPQPPTLLTAVLEVSGAVLAWQVDSGDGPRITFTDLRRADWLWRVIGEAGHVEISTRAHRAPRLESVLDFGHLAVDPNAVAPLRKIALGHWLRRWWPGSARDGIVALDPALLDAELAVLTDAAQHFFTDNTFDSDVAALLAPHAVALALHAATGDPRVTGLVRACTELADELGMEQPGWSELKTLLEQSPPPGTPGVRSDYALAAGPPRQPGVGVVAGGVASLMWAAVPAAVFDAAENTINWSIVATGAQPFAVVTVQTANTLGAAGIPVRLVSGAVSAVGVLDDAGGAVLPLETMSESAAWDQDWSTTTVTVGAETAEEAQLRDRVRSIARARLTQPRADAYLAEILAAESDY